MLNEVLNYVRKHARVLPANRWTATSASGKSITVLDHRVGVNLSQGPWLKFKIDEGGEVKTITAIKRFKGGDRIQYETPAGGNRECGADDFTFTGAISQGDGQIPVDAHVIVKLSFEWPEAHDDDQQGPIHFYRFVGKTN